MTILAPLAVSAWVPALPTLQGEPTIRVALVPSAPAAEIGATGAWRVYAADGRTLLYRPSARDRWLFEPVGGRVRGASRSGLSMAPRGAGVVLRPVDESSQLLFNGKRYRGDIVIVPAGQALLVVNRLGLESYLRGVVPLEIGRRTEAELAAVKAQAVAARSYAHTRIRTSAARPFDLVGTVANQVYGGVDAESALSDNALGATRGVVLHYEGRPVDGPYHASCGGRTAAAGELYGAGADRPYLRSVSDRISGSDTHYCDIYPRAAWTRVIDASDVQASLEKYLRDYVSGIGGSPGRALSVDEIGRTASGRASGLSIRTDRATHVVRGNNARFVVRPPNGEILPSTYFSAESVRSASGTLLRVTFTGRGNGHGVGMCQWGAIGRARFGHSWENILQTYYPGTRLEKIY
ncbi:MAG TPA: SpoIID/LytB domain-containing protein [Gemmatimonadaceae bacterium]|nr:SpoIID/LytB domain-containing protein [Gemmatimonadaceae bacterium]